MRRATLALADGTVFQGQSLGAVGERVGEVVFNTSMAGYQEILTDPSYAQQLLTMTCPEMGAVGTNPADAESERPHAVGMVVRRATELPSNWRAEESLGDFLKRHDVVAIQGVDTRRLVRHLRVHGTQMAVLSSEGTAASALIEKARTAGGMEGSDLATLASTATSYVWTEPTPALFGEPQLPPALQYDVVAVDYGLKRSMLRLLVDAGCRVTVVPASSSAEEILARKPHGVFLSNGPGDPAAVKGAAQNISALLGKVPLFGICLGHQLLALALGAKTFKMKFGHRGGNHPVQELATGRVEMTSQNHGFAVDAESIRQRAQVTHLNLNDRTVEGLVVPGAKAFSVQFHPESSPGPQDARHLFGRFTRLMEG